MAALFYAIQVQRYRLGRTHTKPRFFRDRTNVLELYDDEALIRDFRFPRKTIEEIIGLCSGLSRSTKRNHALPVHIQVLAGLRFFVRGVFQDDGKDIIGMSQPSYCRLIQRMANILCARVYDFIKFPRTDDEIAQVKQGFYAKFGFPNVLGVIDGTHIAIQTPADKDLEPLYVCRKGGHSINVQVICDHECRFLDVVAKWPGATHDSFIWQNSGRRREFERSPPNGWLIGDVGYGLEPWLITAYDQCPTQSHKNFNQALRKTRSIVERSIGLWKGAFRRLDKSGGSMMYQPGRVCKIIIACAILHNMRRTLRLPEDEDFLVEPSMFEDPDSHTPSNSLFQLGDEIRNTIRENFFNN